MKHQRDVSVDLETVEQSFKIMSCSWGTLWKTDDKSVGSLGAPCDKNVEITIDLAPGAVDTRTLEVTVSGMAPLGAHSLRFGFTPIGATITVWSKNVTMQVIDVAKR